MEVPREDPALWAHWVAPCPVRKAEVRRTHLKRRRINERMADRTQARQPMLPLLVDHVTNQWLYFRDLLAATEAVGLEEQFTHDGMQWQAHRERERPPLHEAWHGLPAPSSLTATPANWSRSRSKGAHHPDLMTSELIRAGHVKAHGIARPSAWLLAAPRKLSRDRLNICGGGIRHCWVRCVEFLVSTEKNSEADVDSYRPVQECDCEVRTTADSAGPISEGARVSRQDPVRVTGASGRRGFQA